MKKKDKQSDPQVEAEEIKASEETAGQKPDSDKASQPDDSSKELEDLKALLEEAQKDAAAKQELLLRTAAEYDNYRKRTAREKDATFNNGVTFAVTQLLPVVDTLEMAAAAPTEDENYKKGVEMTMTQLEEILNKMNVTPIPAVGEKFDPALHNAVMHVEDETVEDSIIVQEYEKGFKLGDKVIRFSVVVVAN